MSATTPLAVKWKLSYGSSVFVDSASKSDTVDLFVKREIGLPTRSTARKRLDRELIVTCSLSVRLKFDGCFIGYVNMYASHVTLLLLSTFMILEYP